MVLLHYYAVDDFQDYVNFTISMEPDQNVTLNQQFINSDRTDVWGGNVKMVDLDGDGDLDVNLLVIPLLIMGKREVLECLLYLKMQEFIVEIL